MCSTIRCLKSISFQLSHFVAFCKFIEIIICLLRINVWILIKLIKRWKSQANVIGGCVYDVCNQVFYVWKVNVRINWDDNQRSRIIKLVHCKIIFMHLNHIKKKLSLTDIHGKLIWKSFLSDRPRKLYFTAQRFALNIVKKKLMNKECKTTQRIYKYWRLLESERERKWVYFLLLLRQFLCGTGMGGRTES